MCVSELFVFVTVRHHSTPSHLFTTYITKSWNPQAAVNLHSRGQREGIDQINRSYSLSKVQTFFRAWTLPQTDLGLNPIIAITSQESSAE